MRLEKSLLDCRSCLSKASKRRLPRAGLICTAVTDKADDNLHEQEDELRNKLKVKWKLWRRNHLYQNALQRADEGPEISRRLGLIELKVSGGQWMLGPRSSPFAKLTLREMSFSMELDQRLGVPVLFVFAIDEFRLKPAKENEDYFSEVLGPRSETITKGNAFRPKFGTMLSVRGRRLPKFAGEQMVLEFLEFELHPLDVRRTRSFSTWNRMAAKL